MGMVLRRYIDFFILLIPTLLVSVHFCCSIPSLLFVHLKIFFSVFSYIFFLNEQKVGMLL